jgi:hypothetical protein
MNTLHFLYSISLQWVKFAPFWCVVVKLAVYYSITQGRVGKITNLTAKKWDYITGLFGAQRRQVYIREREQLFFFREREQLFFFSSSMFNRSNMSSVVFDGICKSGLGPCNMFRVACKNITPSPFLFPSDSLFTSGLHPLSHVSICMYVRVYPLLFPPFLTVSRRPATQPISTPTDTTGAHHNQLVSPANFGLVLIVLVPNKKGAQQIKSRACQRSPHIQSGWASIHHLQPSGRPPERKGIQG